jgi:hypothetical protein
MTIKNLDVSKLSTPEKLLWRYGVTEPQDIDLEAIAFGLGAEVRYRKLDGCDARIIGNNTTAIISINADAYRPRQRFSLAHEIGHWHEDRGNGGFFCAAEDIGPQNEVAKSKEALANAFASQLILPDYLFKPRILNLDPTIKTACLLADEFNASLTATSIKLAKSTLKPAMLVCHSQTQREWFFRSKALASDIWPVNEIHHDTIAFELLFGGSSNKFPIKHDAASNWLTGPGIYG